MKLSNETLTVLKNFASINQGIQFKKGKQLRTMSGGKSVLARAEIKDEVPEDFCVYDLNQFLSVNSLFKDSAELNFDDANIIFGSGRKKMSYRKTDKSMITVAPDKDLTLPNVDCEFTLSADDYDWLMDTAKIISSPHISIESDGEKITMSTFDAEDDSAHVNTIDIKEGAGRDRKSTRLNSSHSQQSRMPSSA